MIKGKISTLVLTVLTSMIFVLDKHRISQPVCRQRQGNRSGCLKALGNTDGEKQLKDSILKMIIWKMFLLSYIILHLIFFYPINKILPYRRMFKLHLKTLFLIFTSFVRALSTPISFTRSSFSPQVSSDVLHLMKSQKGWGWVAPQEVTWYNTLAHVPSPREG